MSSSRFLTGFHCVLTGLRMLNHPQLRALVIVPLIINVVMFSVALWLAVDRFGEAMSWLSDELPDMLVWMVWLFWPVFALAVLLFVFYSFTFFANLVAAPFNGLLAGKAEAVITGKAVPDSPGSVWKEIVAAPLDELRKLGFFVLVAVPVLLTFFIPLVQIIAPFAWAILGVWMLGIEYLDFPMGNHGIRFRDQRKYLAAHRAAVLGFGAGALLLTLIPVVNFIAIPVAVIGATALYATEIRPSSIRAP